MTADGATGTTRHWPPVPAPWALCGLVALGAVAVLLLPAAGSSLPWEIDPEPNATQLAATAFGVMVLTAGYLLAAAREAGWQRTPALLTFGYLTGIAVVKFILSPASFHNTPDTTLGTFVWLGLAVMALYLVALALIYREVRRPTVLLVVAALVLALLSRYLLAVVLGRDAGDYLGDIFSGAGWWLLALIGGSVVAAVESFRSGDRASLLRAGTAVIVVYHGLWALFMFRLFD